MSRGRVLIVDGYNVLRSATRYRSLAERDIEVARARLVDDVAGFAHKTFDATIVFDGAENPLSNGAATDVAGVNVIFSPFGSDADSVIEALAQSAREAAKEVIVVTSDAQTQWAVMGGIVRRMSAAEFVGALLEHGHELGEAVVSRKAAPIAERVDDATRKRLDRMARGESN